MQFQEGEYYISEIFEQPIKILKVEPNGLYTIKYINFDLTTPKVLHSILMTNRYRHVPKLKAKLLYEK